MIRFLAPLVGIVAGLQVIPIDLAPEVDRYIARLDGAVVARAGRDEPVIEIDLGRAPRTHRLDVVAFRPDGSEAGQATQWLNQPRTDADPGGPPRTAVPIVLEDPGLDSGALAGRFLVGDELATPVAISGGGARIVIVLDPSSQRSLRILAEKMEENMERAGYGAGSWDHPVDLAHLLLPLGGEDEVILVWTGAFEAAQDPARRWDLFSTSHVYPREGEKGGLSWLLARVEPPPLPERIADAVCAAGRLAAAVPRPRAVILVADPRTVDGSLLRASQARRYLADLRVPFGVWTAAGEPGELESRWGRVESVATWDRLAEAIAGLRRGLESQRIVWLEGVYLAREVSRAPGATGFVLAGAREVSE